MELEEVVNFNKALADETRVRVLMAVYQHELCLCHLVHTFNLANSTISKHLDILKRNDFIYKRKEGRFHYFCFNNKYQQQIQWLLKLLESDVTVQRDREIIQQMINKKLEHLPEVHAMENTDESK